MSTSQEEVVAKVSNLLTSEEWDLMRTYFYSQFFNYLSVTATTPDLGKTFKFSVTVNNIDFDNPVEGQLKVVASNNQLHRYDGVDWEFYDTFQIVKNFTDTSINTEKIVYNSDLDSYFVYVSNQWIKLHEYRTVVQLIS
jgi:hypothetical protein